MKLVNEINGVEIDFIFTRNIPQNITAELDNAIKGRTFLSQKTVLGMVPSIVPDVNDEIKRIEEEAEKHVNNMFSNEVEEHEH